MAVDYFHRLLIVGPPKDVSSFRSTMYREYPPHRMRKDMDRDCAVLFPGAL
jgi:hypothetical protein